LVHEYLMTVLNASPQITLTLNTTNGSPTTTFVFPSGTTAWPIGPSPIASNITPGMTVSGTGITAGTRVLSVQQGPGGITGVTLDANATATGSASIIFSPTILIDSLRQSTL